MSAGHVAQTAVGKNRLMNPFDPIGPSILRAIEEMQRVLRSRLGNSFSKFQPRSRGHSHPKHWRGPCNYVPENCLGRALGVDRRDLGGFCQASLGQVRLCGVA